MMSHTDLVLELLATDLASFADPGTELKVESSASSQYRISWLQDGKRRNAVFTVADDGPPWPSSVQFNGVDSSYSSFIAGAHMADLRGVARNISSVLPETSNYISLESVRIDDPDVSRQDIADSERLIDALAVSGDGRTNVLFVTADAGVGKTSLLRHLARQKAVDYMRGATTSLWLYVDAQGRRLAQLDDAIAAVLDDARAKFPYHSTTSLVRTGAMVLVVDGFDELIGSVGSYDEAFSSLAKFISDLGGYGCIVAAARSTYYEQEFLTRTSTTLAYGSDSWFLSAIRLLDWSDEKRNQYLRGEAASRGRAGYELDEVVRATEEALSAPDVRGVGYKPFFVSRTLDALFDESLPEGAGLLDRLVAAYVKREVAEKLKSPATGKPMLDSEQYRFLLTEIAEEMWLQETRELSNTSIREIAEILGSMIGLQGEILREVVERLPYGAILARGSVPGGVAFEHDIYYSYFLAQPIARTWIQGDTKSLTQFLRRGKLPEEAAVMAGRLLGVVDVQSHLNVLSSSPSRANGDAEQVRRNVGALAGGLLDGAALTGVTLSQLAFGDIPINGLSLTRSAIRNCHFIGTDLSKVRFAECRAESVQLDRVIVDPSVTVLDIEGLNVADFYGLGVRTEFGERWVFSPVEITAMLAQCSLPSALNDQDFRPVDPAVVEIIDRLCRFYLKTNAITEADSGMARIISDPRWKEVRSALISSEVISLENKAASGNKVFLRRNSRPQEIMRGMRADTPVSSSIDKLWDLLELIR